MNEIQNVVDMEHGDNLSTMINVNPQYCESCQRHLGMGGWTSLILTINCEAMMYSVSTTLTGFCPGMINQDHIFIHINIVTSEAQKLYDIWQDPKRRSRDQQHSHRIQPAVYEMR